MADMTEAEQQIHQAELNHAFKLGISKGMEDVGNALLKKAGETWAAGNDSYAGLLRLNAQEILRDAAKAHP